MWFIRLGTGDIIMYPPPHNLIAPKPYYHTITLMKFNARLHWSYKNKTYV